jgi:hypothetical protein
VFNFFEKLIYTRIWLQNDIFAFLSELEFELKTSYFAKQALYHLSHASAYKIFDNHLGVSVFASLS